MPSQGGRLVSSDDIATAAEVLRTPDGGLFLLLEGEDRILVVPLTSRDASRLAEVLQEAADELALKEASDAVA